MLANLYTVAKHLLRFFLNFIPCYVFILRPLLWAHRFRIIVEGIKAKIT